MMSMKVFGIEKFKSLLLAGSFTVLASYVVRLSDSIIAGNMLGETALAGVNLAGPCLSAISFLSSLISIGCGTQYSIAMGRCDRRRAREYFTQALWSVLIFGGGLALTLCFGRDVFLAFMGADAESTAAASRYLAWAWPQALLDGLLMLLISLGYADGDSRLCSLAYAVVFVGNFAVSIAGVSLGMGIAGCAFGSVISETAGVLVMCVHFLRKTNSFAPVRHFSLVDSARIFAASFGDAAAFLCDGLLFFFLNKFVIGHFGSGLLPVVGAVTALWGFLEFFNGVGVAIQPIVTVYYGERNTRSARTVMNAAMLVSIAEGVAFMAFFGLFPEAAVKLVGISDPALSREACSAVRLMCCGFIPLSLAGLFNSYYMFIEKSLLAGLVTFLCYLILPVACVAACSTGGAGGVWTGLGLGPFAGAAIASLCIVALEGRKMYPLMLSRARDARLHVYDLALVESDIVRVSREIAGALTTAGVSDQVVIRASLLVEEVFMAVRDRNAGRKVLAEATLDLNDGVALTLRDDGEIFDITDADQQISSLRTFLVASMMQYHDGRLNLVTTGFNRNVFRF